MILYSAKLPVVESFEKDDFIKLVIQWNQGSPYDRMNGIQWKGSRNVRYQDGEKTLAIEELRACNIVATRFRKEDENRIVWTTDFILNFDEHILAVRLDRETTEDTISFVPTFSPPHLIKMMVRDKYAGMDDDLDISDEPLEISENNYTIIRDVILQRKRYALPIVYVTKTWAGNYPFDVNKLARRLQGVAHVLKESDSNVSKLLMQDCNKENVHHGGVGIYYPNQSAGNKKISTSQYYSNEDRLIERIVNYIYRYSNQQKRESMYTWEGVQNELLRLKNISLTKKRQDAETANQQNMDLLDVYSEEVKSLETTVKELNNRISALTQENQGLRAKLDGTNNVPLIFFGEEDDLFEGEIREIVLEILSNSLKQQQENSRRADVLSDLLDANEYLGIADEKRNRIKHILRGYSTMNASMRADLQDFGFQISAEGKHYKLIYYDDPRYVATMSKTGSDGRAGDNLSSKIDKIML